jgi:prepilin-type N-terminal cleavage/methylation domain-containing protein
VRPAKTLFYRGNAMRKMKRQVKILYDNTAMSLVEILVVVAIMSIVAGSAGLGISLAYSRDAEKCAQTINAALENARMLSLSEKGTFTLELDMTNNMLYIRSSESSTPVHEENLQKRVQIYVPDDTSLTGLTVQFDKSTGKVVAMDGENNGILTITAENNNGKKASVVLVKGTGKHYVDYQ